MIYDIVCHPRPAIRRKLIKAGADSTMIGRRLGGTFAVASSQDWAGRIAGSHEYEWTRQVYNHPTHYCTWSGKKAFEVCALLVHT